MKLRFRGLRRNRDTWPAGSDAEDVLRALMREGRSAPETDPRWQARQARIERAVWAALAALVLSGLAVLGAIALFCQPAPVNTGDKLLDAYLQMLVDEDKILGQANDEIEPADLDETQWQQLEARFGHESRFWMLCFNCRRPNLNVYHSLEAGVDLDPSYSYLEKARKSGLADGPILLRLWQGYEGEWRGEAAKALVLPALPRNPRPTNAETAQRIKRIYAEVTRRHSTEQRKLIAELLAVAPNEAQAHYAAAQFAIGRGDYAEALAEFRAGNAAPSNSSMPGFPFDELINRAQRGAYICDKPITGYLACRYSNAALPNFIYQKEVLKTLLYEIVQRRDAEGLDVLHSYACRFTDADGQSIISSLVGIVLIGLVYDAAAKDWPQHNYAPGKLTALGELKAKRDQLKSQIKAISALQGSFFNIFSQPRGIQGFLDALHFALTNGRGINLVLLNCTSDDLLAEQQGLTGPVRKLVREIERFDYTKLAWE